LKPTAGEGKSAPMILLTKYAPIPSRCSSRHSRTYGGK
jgi:hypothetical protein